MEIGEIYGKKVGFLFLGLPLDENIALIL